MNRQVQQASREGQLDNKSSGHIKKCPGTPGYVCCGYFILDIGKSCPYGCSYCFLRFYLRDRKITLCEDPAGAAEELDRYLASQNRTARLGTGEFTDSCYSPEILKKTADILSLTKQKNFILELKTKNAQFDFSGFLPYRNHLVFSFSLNPAFIHRRFEIRTSPPAERISKISLLQKNGFHTGLHFDPVIHYSRWKKDYDALVDSLKHLSPSLIPWISLGSLRFRQDLLDQVIKMKGITKEFITGKDKKLRYFRDLRIEIYGRINERLKKLFGREPRIYLCMEEENIWLKALGEKITSGRLSESLDKQAEKVLNL